MKIIWLSNKTHYVKVDDDMYDELIKFKWHYAKSTNTGYATRQMIDENMGKKINVRMHRYIMNVLYEKDKIIDHINGNGLDNQRHNLRICTQKLNGINRGACSGSLSKYKCIDIKKDCHKKYAAYISINGIKKGLGYFYTEDAAALAYDDYLREYLKTFSFQTENSRCFNLPNLTEQERGIIFNKERKVELEYLYKYTSIYNNVVLVKKNNNGLSLWRIKKPNYIDKKRAMIGDYISEIDAAIALDYFIIKNGAENQCKLNFKYTEEDIKLIKNGTKIPPKSYKELSKSFIGVKRWYLGKWKAFVGDITIGLYKNSILAAKAYDKYVKDNGLKYKLNFD